MTSASEKSAEAPNAEPGGDSGQDSKVLSRVWQLPLYGLSVFLASAGALVIEIVAGRMIAPYVGMSLYTWTAVISVVLAGLSLGHWVGGRLSETDARRAHWRLALLLGAAALTAGSALPLIRLAAPAILGAGLSPIAAIAAVTTSLFFLPSFFIGGVSPILTRLAILPNLAAPGRAIGTMYAAGALGSIFGTLAAGYFFISWIGTAGTLLSVTALYVMLCLGFGLAARPPRGEAAVAVVGGLLVAFGLGFAAQRAGAFANPCDVESDYYCIRVVDLSDELERPAAVMVLDHLGHGINDREDPAYLHSSYLALIDKLLNRTSDPSEGFSAFFIGGGANTLPRAWQDRYPRARITVSEIDPAVTHVAETALWFTPGPRVTLDHRDARVALAKPLKDELFDVVVGDAFRDISVPQHLTTVEFATLLSSRLSPEGFYALNVIDSGRQPLFVYAMVRTLGEVFANVEVWVDVDQLSSGGRMTYLVVAAAQPSGAERLSQEGPGGYRWWRWPDDDLTARMARVDVPILSDDYAPVDRLMLHVLKEDP